LQSPSKRKSLSEKALKVGCLGQSSLAFEPDFSGSAGIC